MTDTYLFQGGPMRTLTKAEEEALHKLIRSQRHMGRNREQWRCGCGRNNYKTAEFCAACSEPRGTR